MDSDPGETKNLWDQPDAAAAALKEQLHQYFDAHADARYDLWHGGKSKAPTLVFPKPPSR